MNAAGTKPLRPTDTRTVEGLLRRLGVLWKAPGLADITVTLNPRLRRTVGRLLSHPWRIELGLRALGGAKKLREAVTHEGAHAALATNRAPTRQHPHGPEWRELMALAGYPDARGAHWRCSGNVGQRPRLKRQPKPAETTRILYDHWCPVCQSTRVGWRLVKAWRCAACVAAGLSGRLEITPRTRRPTAAR